MALQALAQLSAYGALMYAAGALLPLYTHGDRTTVKAASFAISAGLFLGAGNALIAGALLDRFGATAVRRVGSGAAIAGLATWALAPGVEGLLVGLTLSGAALPFLAYETTYVAISERLPPAAWARALSSVTLVGGLASAVFVPLLGGVALIVGWRAAVGMAAGLLLASHLPLLHIWPAQTPTPPTQRSVRSALPTADTGSPPWGLSILIEVTSGVIAGAIAVHIVSVLLALGLSPSSAFATASLMGIGAVGIRLTHIVIPQRRALTLVAVSYVGQTAALALLATYPNHASVVACVLVLGAGVGSASIARPLIATRGTLQAPCGRVLSRLSAGHTLARAAGPALFGLLTSLEGSARVGLLALAATGLISAIAVLGLATHTADS